ncbi:PAS domain S-box protein [Oceanihabitans sp. IOP_32]|uniref:PAS domain-containing sensor histidine kinase n=1 Tax=Oceanihabitans sp. IOP_32 TaxID=2529032 RepID=UPI001292FB2C|nr:PAS domain-containing sensor histidine kinase [Oceanihabitans sp. IOP_32]QFZ53692.1 PAS domain S-box protein [Oceanihabitans sp. IOP_32]
MFKKDQDIFNILLEAISEGVIIVDKDQHIVEFNSFAQDIFGYTKGEIVERALHLLIPSKYHATHFNYIERFIERGKRRKIGSGVDVYGLKKDGTIFPAEVELNPFYIYNKTYIMVLVKDISEKKKTEKTLMLKSRALESASNGIVITDALQQDNPIIYFNAAFQKLTGYETKEILNNNCRFLQGNDNNQKPLKKLRKAVKKGESCQVILRNYKKDGTLFWNDLYVMPITNNEGIVTNFIGIQNDVTKRMEIEEERQHLATIFDESLNEIFVFDAKSLKFLNANYGAQKNIGYALEELINMTPLDVKLYNDEADFRKITNTLLHNREEKLKFETVNKRKDGSTYPAEVHLQLSYLGEKEVFVAFIIDISERINYTTKLEKKVEERTKQLEIALNKEKELNELKTKFLSLVSHEFKTPLSGILTSSQLLSKYTLSEQQEKRDKHIKTITDKVHYLNNILNDFLSFEKLESGKVNYKLTHFKLSKVLNEVVYNANMLLKEGQQINYPINVDELTIFQDEKIVELVLSNLLYNAINYSPEHKPIEIEVEQNSKNTIFKIKDQGIGIPAKDQKHVFERYFRAENVVNTQQGTGIGLNIVKNNLENLGGEISFVSEENKGTIFTVIIPNQATL